MEDFPNRLKTACDVIASKIDKRQFPQIVVEETLKLLGAQKGGIYIKRYDAFVALFESNGFSPYLEKTFERAKDHAISYLKIDDETYLIIPLYKETTLQAVIIVETTSQTINASHLSLYQQFLSLCYYHNTFLSTISHELRNQLTPMLGYTEMLAKQQEGTGNKEEKLIDALKKSMEKMKKTLETQFRKD